MEHLHDLSLCLSDNYTSSGAAPITVVALVFLNTLEICLSNPSDMLASVQHWHLPSLRCISLCGQDVKQVTDSTKIIPFFEVHGPRLTILEFDCIARLGTIYKHCHNLSEVVTQTGFAVSHLGILELVYGHPNLTCFGLRGFLDAEANVFARFEATLFFHHAFPILLDKQRYPKLQTVRLLDYNHDRFFEHEWFVSQYKIWSYWSDWFKRDEQGSRTTMVVSLK